MDLYATPNQTFWRVTFPLVFPGILGAALLSFSLSFDDFIITNLNAGTTTTFPMYVWGVSRKTIPMQINVVGTVMLIDLGGDRGRWRDAQPRPEARPRRPRGPGRLGRGRRRLPDRAPRRRRSSAARPGSCKRSEPPSPVTRS